MAEVRPFVGLLFDPAVAGPLDQLTAPPYDLITDADQARLYRASPHNVVRLDLGRDERDDNAAEDKYTRAATYLRSWVEDGVLVATEGPRMYPYELRFQLQGDDRLMRGVIAEVALDPRESTIIPHERTLPGPIKDRLSLLRKVQANLSPIYTVFAEPSDQLSASLGRAMTAPPEREVTDETGTTHRLWVADHDIETIAKAMRDKTLMIADGHHRYTVALAFREEMRDRRGPGPWDGMMMFIVDAGTEDPPVLPIHRVAERDGLRDPGAARRVRDMTEILASVRDEDLTYGSVRIEQGRVIHRIATLKGTPPTVRALHEEILDRVKDIRLHFTHDAVAAERAVVEGDASVAYLLPATNVERVWTLVRAGQKMPQKSTYFWPKPRTGLVIRPFMFS
jgi:uncharacterized protein (DUF1015 family)